MLVTGGLDSLEERERKCREAEVGRAVPGQLARLHSTKPPNLTCRPTRTAGSRSTCRDYKYMIKTYVSPVCEPALFLLGFKIDQARFQC
jgi:hypothetical protein